MAEYYPLLARAISSLQNSTPDSRAAIYERARKALLGQLRSIDPPVAEEDIQRESEALDEAVAKLEGELAARAAASEAPKPAPVPSPLPPAPPTPAAPSAKPPLPPFVRQPSAATARTPIGAGLPGAPARPTPPAGEDEQRPAPPRPPGANPAVKPFQFTKLATANPAPMPPPSGRSQTGDRTLARPAPRDVPQTPPAGPGPTPTGQGTFAQELSKVEAQQTGASSPAPHAPAPTVEKPEPTGGPDLAKTVPLSTPPFPTPALQATAATKPADTSADSAVVTDDGDIAPVPDDATGDTRVSDLGQGILRKFGRPRSPLTGATMPRPAPAARDDDEADAPGAPADTFARTRNDGARPMAPQAVPTRSGRLRHVIVATVVGLTVLAVAVTAYQLRDRPEDIAKSRPAPVADQADTSGKIAERIGGGQPRVTQPLGAPTAPATSAPGAAQTAAAPVSTPTVPSNPPVPVAQRAALLVQAPTPTDPQAVATFVGNVIWRVDTVSAGQGQPNAVAVRADIDVPEAKLKVSVVFTRNTDETLPASHMIDVRFTFAPGATLQSVKQIDSPQMRREDTPAGDALAGLARPVRDNYFFIALAKGDSYTTRNLDLIKTRSWFDVPMLMSDNKIAKITFEKGPSGDRAFSDALRAWGQ